MWIPLVQEIFLPPIFLKITQELTENDAFDGEENGRWGWVKNSFCLPIVLPSPQGVTQLRKHKIRIPLIQEIFLPPIFLEIAQGLTENDAFDGGGMKGGGELKKSFCIPTALASRQGARQHQKRFEWIPLDL